MIAVNFISAGSSGTTGLRGYPSLHSPLSLPSPPSPKPERSGSRLGRPWRLGRLGRRRCRPIEPDPGNAGVGTAAVMCGPPAGSGWRFSFLGGDPEQGGMPMDRQGLRRLVELAIAVALTAVLSQIRVYKLPQGGSITAGSMVPIFYVALRWGFRWGVLAGLLAGVVNYITEPFYVHPVQVLLDYPIAFGAIGLAGLFQRRPVAGVVVGGAGRFVAHFLSGIVFFASYAPKGVSPAVYSAVYNGSYMLPEVIISSILTVLVLRAMERVQPVQPA